MNKFPFKSIGGLILLVITAFAGYFINVEVQSYYGRQALAKAALQNYSLNEAIQKAAAENKLVLVDVSAIWCPTCRRLDNEVFADAEVREKINEKYIFSRLEYESPEGTEFLKQHEAVGFPNLWLLNSEGKVVKKLNITFNPSEFLAQLP